MSDDRIEIGVDQVTRLVSAQFPQWAHLPIRPVEPGGWDNRTFHLGTEMSIRLPSHERYVAQVTKEHTWLPRLAPLLPLPIPQPVGLGTPGEGFPWPWSIYRWMEGETAAQEVIVDELRFAADLSAFLTALQACPVDGAPLAGVQNFFRGGPLTVYDTETRETIAALAGEIDTALALAIWDRALQSTWQKPPVWVHGDIARGNLLVTGGRLSAVIDFGSSGIGDPACDTTIAWTLLTESGRAAFRTALQVDDDTWDRGRGWALWKALITIRGSMGSDPARVDEARRVLEAVMSDHLAAEQFGANWPRGRRSGPG